MYVKYAGVLCSCFLGNIIIFRFLYILFFQQLGNKIWGLAREQGFHGGKTFFKLLLD